MQTFTGKEYIKIDVANQYGLDKWNWNERIEWFDSHDNSTLWDMVDEAKEPDLYRKALFAWDDAIQGIPSGHMVGLDSCSSGVQILAVLSGCAKAATYCGLVDTGKREDFYKNLVVEMNKILPESEWVSVGGRITHEDVKKCGMIYFYGGRKQIKETFIENSPQYDAFFRAINYMAPGPVAAMEAIQACWQPNNTHHTWTLPDGHTAHVPVTTHVDTKIEVDELDHATFTQRKYINQAQPFGLSLPANVTHSNDGYVVGEMERMSVRQDFELLTIHDDFRAHPNYCNNVRYNYRSILADMAEADLLQDQLRQITGNQNLRFYKQGPGTSLAKEIRYSNYALS